jgi:hypothetical protein
MRRARLLPALSLVLVACPSEVQPPPTIEPPASTAAPADTCAPVEAARSRAAQLSNEGFLDRALRTLDAAGAGCPKLGPSVAAQRAEIFTQLGRCAEAKKAGAAEQDLTTCAKLAADSSDSLLAAARAAKGARPADAQRLFERATSALERELAVSAELLDAPLDDGGVLTSEDGTVALTFAGGLYLTSQGAPPDRWRSVKSGFDGVHALSADGKTMVVREPGVSKVVDVATLKARSTLSKDVDTSQWVELTPDGSRMLATIGYEAYVFDTSTGAPMHVVAEEFDSSGSGFYRVELVDGGRFALIQMMNTGTRIVDLDAGATLVSRTRNGPWSFSEDGRFALTCEGLSEDDDFKYVVFDLHNKGKVKAPHGTLCYAPELADPRGYLLLLGKDNTESYLDVRTGKKVAELPPEPPKVAAPKPALHPLAAASQALRKGKGIVGGISHDARFFLVDPDLVVDLTTGQPAPREDTSAACDTRFGSCETFKVVPGGVSLCPTGKEPCTFVELKHEAKWQARSRSGERLVLWDDKKLSILDVPGLKVVGHKVFPDKIFDADFVGPGDRVESVLEVIAGKSLVRFDSQSGKELDTRAFSERYDSASIVRGGMGTIIDVFDQKTIKLVSPSGVTLWEQAFGQSDNPWWYWPDGSVLLVAGTTEQASAFKLPGGEPLGVYTRKKNTKLFGHYVVSATVGAGAELYDVLAGGQRTSLRNYGKGDYFLARGAATFDAAGGGAGARVVVHGAMAEQVLTCRFGSLMMPFEVCRGRFQVDSLAEP